MTMGLHRRREAERHARAADHDAGEARHEVILGKFLAALGLMGRAASRARSRFPFAVSSLGNLDWGPVWSRATSGMFLHGRRRWPAIGLMCSSLHREPAGGVLRLASRSSCVLALAWLGWLMPFVPVARSPPASPSSCRSTVAPREPRREASSTARDVIYFLSVAGFALMVAFRALESRRWS
jgi:hypothetical protein